MKRLVQAPWISIPAAIAVGTSSYFIAKFLSQYGVDGAFRLLWEGSPYPPDIREQHEKLDAATTRAESLLQSITAVELGLAEAQVAADDDSNFASILRQWQANIRPVDNLQQRLAFISNELDVLAAQIDAVVCEKEADVKQRRKDLARDTVDLMDRVDALISFYNKATS
jgi:chaperonin cofactor prefoldin